HNASADVEATTRCFFELVRIGNFTIDELQAESNYLDLYRQKNPTVIQSYNLIHHNLKKESERIKAEIQSQKNDDAKVIDLSGNKAYLENVPFSHLHNHTQFSVLQSTTRVKNLVKRAVEYACPAV